MENDCDTTDELDLEKNKLQTPSEITTVMSQIKIFKDGLNCFNRL